MKTTIKIWYEEKYLPNKRCRKLRTRVSNKDVDVDVREVTENEFPIAFVVHDMQSVYEGATSYSDFDGNGDYKMHTEDIRTYAGKLYKPIRISCGTAISTLFEPLAEMKYKLMEPEPYWMGGEDFSDQSIVKSDNFTEKLKIAKEKASSYLIYEKKSGQNVTNQCIISKHLVWDTTTVVLDFLLPGTTTPISVRIIILTPYREMKRLLTENELHLAAAIPKALIEWESMTLSRLKSQRWSNTTHKLNMDMEILL